MIPVEFTHPALWHLVWIAALVGGVASWLLLRRRARLRAFAEPALLRRLAPTTLVAVSLASIGLAVVALAAIAIAAMDPRWGARYEDVQRRGMDVIFVVDVSRSMTAGDASPDRLDRAREFVSDALQALAGDRVGLVAFAGDAEMVCPLTLNYDTVLTALDELEVRTSARGGSLLGEAIRVAAAGFPEELPGGKAIVILSDGEDMESDPVGAAAKALAEGDVETWTIGIGDAVTGARIPVRTRAGTRWLRHEGADVWTKLDPATLRAVADAGGGRYLEAGTARIDLADVVDRAIAADERVVQESSRVKVTVPRFQWLVAPAIAFLVVRQLIDALGANSRRRTT